MPRRRPSTLGSARKSGIRAITSSTSAPPELLATFAPAVPAVIAAHNHVAGLDERGGEGGERWRVQNAELPISAAVYDDGRERAAPGRDGDHAVHLQTIAHVGDRLDPERLHGLGLRRILLAKAGQLLGRGKRHCMAAHNGSVGRSGSGQRGRDQQSASERCDHQLQPVHACLRPVPAQGLQKCASRSTQWLRE